jgi:sulfide:quinone oxidoreductase
MKTDYQVLVVGAGTAGIMVAAQLKNANSKLDIAILDPAEMHYYQPAWTLVGAGAYNFAKTARPMSSLIPAGVTWIQDKATELKPEENQVVTAQNGSLTYDFLVMAPGLVMEPSLIEGLEDALAKDVVVSNYINPEKTWQKLKEFKGGNAVFTQPTTPIKCGGAPQKIAYLAADYLKRKGLSQKSEVIFATPGSVIFGVKEIKATLMQVIEKYGIHFKPYYAPLKIDADRKEIVFRYVHPEENQCVVNEENSLGEEVHGEMSVKVPFDFLHLAPPQASPKFVRESPLANDTGWLDVDIHSMQHKKYANVFGLGDAAALPTAKTGAAIRKQVPVVKDNILYMLANQSERNKSYNGYSSCPLVTAYDKMVLAEFDYKGNFIPDPKLKRLLIRDSSKEHLRLYWLKKYGLPYLYWNKMMKGAEV